MLGYKVPSSLIEKIERETYHIGDFSYLNGMDKVLDSIKELGEVELDNPWHTGIPTEEGWYLYKGHDLGGIFYDTEYLPKGFSWQYPNDVDEWMLLDK